MTQSIFPIIQKVKEENARKILERDHFPVYAKWNWKHDKEDCACKLWGIKEEKLRTP